MTKNLKVHFSSHSDEWATPQHVFDRLNAYYKFTLDPCASHENHKCEKYFTMEDDGLAQSWARETVFINPPYSDVRSWARKALLESQNDFTGVVGLLPARTDTKWFHESVYWQPLVSVCFIKGRLKFGNAKNSAPFPSMLVYWNVPFFNWNMTE